MKKLLVFVIALGLASFGLISSKLSKIDRELALSELKKSKSLLVEATKGLSDAQLNFKSSPESWSIAECVEHLAISEENIFGMLEKAIQEPANPEKQSEVKVSDEQLLNMIADRSQKVKTSKPFEPTGKYGSFKETLDAFLAKRKQNMKFVKKTNVNLRHHYGQLPFGTIDGVQILLFMSAHTERHTAQILEIKAHESFPKQ